jgi:isovaleryl-CoA dehydrogenase
MWPELTEEQRAFQAMIRSFAEREVAPRAAEIDRTAEFPWDLWRQGAELGLLGISAPEQHGGSGLGVVEMCIMAEEVGAVCGTTSVSYIHQADLVIDNLARSANDEQRERWLPGLCDGSLIGCLAITEPEAGSDALGMRTTAVPVDGGFRVNGTKTFITNAPIADVAYVYLKIGGSAARDISFLAIETGREGVARSQKFDKMGWRGSPTGELSLQDVFVPSENLIGSVGDGLQILMSGLNTERLVLAAQSVGLTQGALDLSVAYARERRQFGQPIADFQLIRGKLATVYSELQAVRALTYLAAKAADAGLGRQLNAQAAAAKLLASELAMRATTEAVQIFGGYGYMKEYPVERLMRDAKIGTIGGGTSEVMQHIIGKALAGGAPTRATVATVVE